MGNQQRWQGHLLRQRFEKNTLGVAQKPDWAGGLWVTHVTDVKDTDSVRGGEHFTGPNYGQKGEQLERL